MFRFAKQNGKSFKLGYTGLICAFDSGNDLVAVCVGVSNILEDFMSKVADRQNLKASDLLDLQINDSDSDPESQGYGNPSQWDDWKIVMDMKESKSHLLQMALASAWSAASLCERFVV